MHPLVPISKIRHLFGGLIKSFLFLDERVGNLSVITKNNSVVPQVKSQLTLVVRGMYSNPPSHGAKIVSAILNDKALTEKW